MAAAEEILTMLRQMKPELTAVFKVHEIGLFGSVVRGEERESSDIDLLVEMDQSADLLDLVGLGQFLEERFHRRIDIVPRGGLRDELKERVLKEVVYP